MSGGRRYRLADGNRIAAECFTAGLHGARRQ
jgi:hypothetical protein